jgi:glyoxylase-like metal-dependent hydrolase (beta-lactamase superfamily II)
MSHDPIQRYADLAGKSPEEAKFYWTGGPIEVAPRTWYCNQFSGVTAFDTDQGLVLIDTGLALTAPVTAKLLREKTQAPVHTALFTHGHVDHAYGLDAFLVLGQPPPRVIGHRNMPARFARYARTAGHNRALNARQFGGAADLGAPQSPYDTFRPPPIGPDTLYDTAITFEVGGLTFEVFHAKGETDDHSWLFCEERSVLVTGDLFIWGVPNAGNPQKAQRYPWEWAAALRVMAARHPRSLCPGHGGPVIHDPELIQRMLLETATFLELIVERTLAALESGSPPHVDIVRSVELPVSSSPWLQPVYDEQEFIVRNVLRHFGGWFSGRPSELKPASRKSVADEIVSLSGGTEHLLSRARQLAEQGELPLACHLLDYALEAAPDDAAVQLTVAELYERRAAAEESLMAINLFRSAAVYARNGRPFR